MKTHRFSDPELYLLTNWPGATLLEESMKAVRKKYDAMLASALDKVTQRHKELDCRAIENRDKWKFKVGIGKRSWPSMYPTWPSGLWLGCVGLRHLASEDADVPYACVWLNPPKSADLHLEDSVEQLRAAATTILPQEHWKDVGQTVKKDQVDIWYPLREPRAKILGMILNNQSHDLIDFIVAQFETLSGFIPVMDEIARSCKRAKK